MPRRVESTDPEGVDFGWVMQTTFVLTVTLGAVVVVAVAAATGIALPTWGDKAAFAIRVGAVVWLLTASGVYLYARRQVDEGKGSDREREADPDAQGHSET